MAEHSKSVRIYLRKILKANVDREFDIGELADMIEDDRGIATDSVVVYSAIKPLRDKEGMEIINVGKRMFKYTGNVYEST